MYPTNDDAVNNTPTENTTKGNENPRISKGTVSRKVTPSGKSPVILLAVLPFKPHRMDMASRAVDRRMVGLDNRTEHEDRSVLLKAVVTEVVAMASTKMEAIDFMMYDVLEMSVGRGIVMKSS